MHSNQVTLINTKQDFEKDDFIKHNFEKKIKIQL